VRAQKRRRGGGVFCVEEVMQKILWRVFPHGQCNVCEPAGGKTRKILVTKCAYNFRAVT